MSKKFKCPFCEKNYLNADSLYEHMDGKHKLDLQGLSPKQVYFNYKNHYQLTKGNGRSVVSGKPTPFNEVTGRYLRFLPEEKEIYRQYFLTNMKRAGKEDIMKDMDHQKEMLAARHISGKYLWSDGKTEFTYTGSYEKKFLTYLDLVLHMPAGDISAPAPQIFTYFDETGRERSHIPDFFISSLNLVVNCKSADNKFYRLRDIEREKLQDGAIKKSQYNYIKIYDNQYDKFLAGIEEIKENMDSNNKTKKQIVIENKEVNEDMNILLG